MSCIVFHKRVRCCSQNQKESNHLQKRRIIGNGADPCFIQNPHGNQDQICQKNQNEHSILQFLFALILLHCKFTSLFFVLLIPYIFFYENSILLMKIKRLPCFFVFSPDGYQEFLKFFYLVSFYNQCFCTDLSVLMHNFKKVFLCISNKMRNLKIRLAKFVYCCYTAITRKGK